MLAARGQRGQIGLGFSISLAQAALGAGQAGQTPLVLSSWRRRGRCGRSARRPGPGALLPPEWGGWSKSSSSSSATAPDRPGRKESWPTATVVTTQPHLHLLADEPDNRILECAALAKADVIVRGDPHRNARRFPAAPRGRV